jgi:hypothetical protein
MVYFPILQRRIVSLSADCVRVRDEILLVYAGEIRFSLLSCRLGFDASVIRYGD